MKDITRRKFLIGGTVVGGTLAGAATAASNMLEPLADGILGAGSTKTDAPAGTEGWDTTYVPATTASLEDAKQASDAVSEQLCDEGIVLLKNDGVLPLSKGITVTPYGYGYLNPAYSGTGAAAAKDTTQVTPEAGLAPFFTINTAMSDAMGKAEAAAPDAASGTSALGSGQSGMGGTTNSVEADKIYEFDASVYQGVDTAGTTAVVFICRNGSEGLDKRTEAYDDGTPHYLALTKAEKEMLAAAKSSCDALVVVLNTANPIEVGPIVSGECEADAILWMGTAGTRGFSSLGKILAGEVNPSGRLTDTWAMSFFSDPTYQNFGDYRYTNISNGNNPMGFVEYEEGVYLGYRYYETAAMENPDFDYDAAVAYPFGYGLSYTSFDQRVSNFTNDDDRVTMTVEVTNTGDAAGKEVVQAYFTAPYTDYDRREGVEKAVANLVAFAKTDLLQSGESAQVEISFATDDMSSYDDHHVNADGTTGAWMLEEGDYDVTLRSDAHTVIDAMTVTVDDTIWFEGDNPTSRDRAGQAQLDQDGNSTDTPKSADGFVAAHNEFPTLVSYMDDPSVTKLSRADWQGTQPTMPDDRQKEAPQVAVDERAWMTGFDPATDTQLGSVKGSEVYADRMPVSRADNGLSLAALRGVPYDDKRWDSLLDQVDWAGEKSDIQELLFMSNYHTRTIRSVAKPQTKDRDGAMSWGGTQSAGASSWASANLLASSWNCDLMREMGRAIGEESLHFGFTGWYAPAVNTHRSAFGGRVYEYFSEDGVLAGKLAAAQIGGAGDKGVISYLKHFALNEQETNRAGNLATWATEQAVREIYLRPFQIALQDARSDVRYLDESGTVQQKTICSGTGVMAAQSNVGCVTGCAHRGLLTGVLREEWGFDGAVVSDLSVAGATEHDLILRAGCDMWLAGFIGSASDYDTATARSVMRESLHRICYAVANSNAMNGIAPGAKVSQGISGWKAGVTAGTVAIVGALAIGWASYARKRKNDPDTSFEDKKAQKAAKKQEKRDKKAAKKQAKHDKKAQKKGEQAGE
ncbi:MAG: glycoside hydrolase family 3 C-terminal domain-containing protein [Olegusella sp.]|nr:glycoside hydrolase family 3 C-terminal domain-containing protein [Olegusella sp.]